MFDPSDASPNFPPSRVLVFSGTGPGLREKCSASGFVAKIIKRKRVSRAAHVVVVKLWHDPAAAAKNKGQTWIPQEGKQTEGILKREWDVWKFLKYYPLSLLHHDEMICPVQCIVGISQHIYSLVGFYCIKEALD